MAIINRYLICFVFLSLLIPSFLFAEDADITFLYTGDLHHFVKEEKDTPVFVSGGTLIDGTGAAPRDNPGILIQEGDFREIGTASAPKGVKHWTPPVNGYCPVLSMCTATLPIMCQRAGTWKMM